MKAISPVVATILLIGITVAAVVGVWMLTQKSARSGPLVKLDVVGAEAVASPDGRRCSFTVTVRNSGTVAVDQVVVRVEVGDQGGVLEPVNATIAPGTTIDFSGEGYSGTPFFNEGKTAKITITYTGPDGPHTLTTYVTIRTSGF